MVISCASSPLVLHRSATGEAGTSNATALVGRGVMFDYHSTPREAIER